jgi:pyridoxal phosphate enzyme (YggS family)
LEVTLLAASKSQSIEQVSTFAAMGQRVFGENYAQELGAKARQLGHLNLEWHFIGHMQSNKIKLLAEHCSCVQSLDNLRHALILWEQLKARGRLPFPVYILVNAGDEAQKSGIAMGDARTFHQQLTQQCPGLAVEGIMAIPPASISESCGPGDIPQLYAELRRLADQIGNRKLSLGMSTDLEAAVLAGSNMIRIGTALFGPRP